MDDEMSLFNVIGTDMTSLDSAWSAVMPSDYDNIVEKRAARAFQECTQRYVYYRKLLAPIPGKEEGVTNPLMDLWFDTRAIGEHLDETPLVTQASVVELEEQEEPALLKAFCSDIQNDSGNYVSWLQFQLTPQVTEGHTSRILSSGRNPIAPIEESHQIIGRIAESKDFLPVKKAFAGIDLSSWHLHNCKAKFGSDVSLYAISYAYSLFRRGRQYGIKMRGKSYTPHWSRIPAQWLPGIDHVESGSHEFNGFTDWGSIVYTLVEKGFVPRESQAIIDLLMSIRGSVQSGNFDLRRKATQDQVKILEDAGTYAKFAKGGPFYTKISSLPQEFVKAVPFVGEALPPILGIVTFLGNNRWIEKVDAKITRMVMWDAYRKAFYIPKVVGQVPIAGNDRDEKR